MVLRDANELIASGAGQAGRSNPAKFSLVGLSLPGVNDEIF